MSKIAGGYCRAVVVDECEFNRIAVTRLLKGLLGVESVTELPSLEPALRSQPDGSVDVVVFNLDPDGAAERRVEEVRLCYPHALRILIASERDPKAIRARLFAGVDAYIPLQLPARAFRLALRDALSKDDPRKRSSAHPRPLSPRQREIVMHLVQGRTSREIGKELDLPSGTVRSHLHEIYRRAGVQDRIGMIRTIAHGRGDFAAEPARLRSAGGS